ncbi:MAG: exodeoxyribonuclease VII small subunit [Chloroflexi bacterium RBG_13_48_10]|nr:MAG: exodeoxyribonuclease VII small subunit [Chloroflexi bacterium RBG_13_48_10]
MSPGNAKIKSNHQLLEELSYEQALAELETIVASLEANKLSLEDAMALFERGQALTKHCIELLDNAELRVKKLSGENLVDVVVED